MPDTRRGLTKTTDTMMDIDAKLCVGGKRKEKIIEKEVDGCGGEGEQMECSGPAGGRTWRELDAGLLGSE